MKASYELVAMSNNHVGIGAGSRNRTASLLCTVWLASDFSDYIIGSTIYIDGGMTLYPGFKSRGSIAKSASNAHATSKVVRRLDPEKPSRPPAPKAPFSLHWYQILKSGPRQASLSVHK